jgi:hypothetical protein
MKRFTLLLASGLLLGSVQTASAFGMGEMMEAASSATGQTKESSLLGMLTSQLGVTPAQASGGAAAILNNASSNMGASDFSKLTDAIPDIKSITDSASTLSSLAGAAGGGSSLIDQFSALGMDGSMIGKFTPIILDYVKKEGGSALMKMLSSAL